MSENRVGGRGHQSEIRNLAPAMINSDSDNTLSQNNDPTVNNRNDLNFALAQLPRSVLQNSCHCSGVETEVPQMQSNDNEAQNTLSQNISADPFH